MYCLYILASDKETVWKKDSTLCVLIGHKSDSYEAAKYGHRSQ